MSRVAEMARCVIDASDDEEVQVFGRSPEQIRYQRTGRCQRCGQRVLLARYSLPDGTRVRGVTLIPLMDKRTIASCPKCGGTWPVFETVVSPDIRPSVLSAMRLTETSRVEEALGQEILRIDNSGPASAVRRLKATRRWTRHIEFDDDHTTTSSHGVGLKLSTLVELKSSAEATYRRHDGESKEIEEKFEEEIELSIPPHAKLELVIHWKRIWQEGLVTGVDTAGVTIQIPFRAVVGLTFDQATR